jgi:hypothetical protein
MITYWLSVKKCWWIIVVRCIIDGVKQNMSDTLMQQDAKIQYYWLL